MLDYTTSGKVKISRYKLLASPHDGYYTFL